MFVKKSVEIPAQAAAQISAVAPATGVPPTARRHSPASWAVPKRPACPRRLGGLRLLAPAALATGGWLVAPRRVILPGRVVRLAARAFRCR